VTATEPIGRDAEVARLVQMVRQPRDLGLSVALVTGASGVGRSTVLAAVAAAFDGPVCRVVALPWEASRSGALLDQLVGSADVDPDPLVAARDLRERLVTAGGGAGHGDSPVLVVVDDADLADAASVEVLGSLVRHERDAPIRLLLSAEPGAAGVVDLADLVVELVPLSAESVEKVAARQGISLSPWVAERLRRHTFGLPGPLTELLAEVEPSTWDNPPVNLPAPRSVATWVAERIEHLEPPARALVEASALLELDHSLALTTAVAAPAPPPASGRGAEVHGDPSVQTPHTDDGAGLWAAVDAAVASGLVRLEGPAGAPQLVAVNPMVRAAVRASLGPAAAARLHLRAAQFATEPTVALVHRVAASIGPDARLAHELEVAAESLAAQGVWGMTARLLVDASRLSDDRRERELRLTRAVDALVGAGDVGEAMSLLPEVEGLRETPLRDAVLGYLAILRGRGSDAAVQLGRAWDIVNAQREPGVAALICQRFVLDSLCRGAYTDLVTWADRASDFVGPDDPAVVEAAAIRGLGLVGKGELEGAHAAYDDLVARVTHGAQAQRVQLGLGWLQLATDDVTGARAALERAVPLRREGGSTRISLWARAWLARAQFRSGEWDAAVRTATQGRELVRRSGIVLTGPLCDWTLVQVHVLRGDDAAAQAALRDAEAAAQDYATMRVPTLLARAAYADAHSDHERVVAALTPLTTPELAEAVAEPGWWPWVELLSTALVSLGRLDEAAQLLGRHEERVVASGHRSAVARLARARGRLLAARGELDAARESFDAAMTALEGLPLRVERAHTQFAYGQVLRRAGKRGEADPLLTAARDGYAAIGAVVLVARCERELKAGGVNATRGERTPLDLTPQERAVAELVAQGRSNREVADELFVSTKTVQYHLTRVYGKLGVRSRTELAAQWNSDG
jgi:DNA-binding CsgD family transcriptional regulator